MNFLSDIQWFGSFQQGLPYQTENPLEEAWAMIARLGTPEYAKSLIPLDKEIDWDKHATYASVRIRQAVELRQSAKSSSTLTKPIMYYYAFLNMIRAYMALALC